MNKATCRGCGAPIVWIKTPAGKAMPCDPAPVYYKAAPGGKDKIVTTRGEAVSCEIVPGGEATDAGYRPPLGHLPAGWAIQERGHSSMTATVAKSKTAAGYFLCRRSEATKLLEKAKTEAAEILKELKAFYTGDIGITAYINRHVMGCSVAGDLTINGEICRSYDPIDLCFLELNELMMKRLIESRKEDDPNGKG